MVITVAGEKQAWDCSGRADLGRVYHVGLGKEHLSSITHPITWIGFRIATPSLILLIVSNTTTMAPPTATETTQTQTQMQVHPSTINMSSKSQEKKQQDQEEEMEFEIDSLSRGPNQLSGMLQAVCFSWLRTWT
jgi:hypothetical protein